MIKSEFIVKSILLNHDVILENGFNVPDLEIRLGNILDQVFKDLNVSTIKEYNEVLEESVRTQIVKGLNK